MDSGYFHFPAFVNNAAVNSGVLKASDSLLSIFLGIFLQVELLGHVVILYPTL